MTGLILALLAHVSLRAEPNWNARAEVPVGGRGNIYELNEFELQTAVRNGRLHALNYPVTVTGLLVPYEAINRFIRAESENPLWRLIQQVFGNVSRLHNFDDVQAWLGMHRYPDVEGSGPYFIPYQSGRKPEHRMGFTLQTTTAGKAFTISCAECHSENLFGRPVLGLSNRFPRANEAFVNVLQLTPHISKALFREATGATRGEAALYSRARRATSFIAAKKPIQLGLDTSLAQVAMSLALRASDEWATLTPGISRPEPLASQPADSKPAVWWNVKYKNRWLSDGSVLSGNPIYTNFVWNEIGRGTNLHDLDSWFAQNAKTIRDLTAAVFASEAPRYTDFFPAENFDELAARRGERHFQALCARCHGHYAKAWNLPGAQSLTPAERLATVQVFYPRQTPVIDVGTDPNRYLGMKSLEQLNGLAISKRQNIVIQSQKGYVPPPLVGIWARWPYFHNNSAPTLCAVLTASLDRPKSYWARPANDPAKDFDSTCNGYPSSLPSNAEEDLYYQADRPGRLATGHDEGIFVIQGAEILNRSEKQDLIRFLQTL